MTKHVGNLPVDEYMAEDASRTFWITRESESKWSLWCRVGSANLALLGSDMRPLTFDEPEQCVRLFRDHSGFDVEWSDFVERIGAQESGAEISSFGDSLSDEKTWIGGADVPPS
jgi:hypothetical protein